MTGASIADAWKVLIYLIKSIIYIYIFINLLLVLYIT